MLGRSRPHQPTRTYPIQRAHGVGPRRSGARRDERGGPGFRGGQFHRRVAALDADTGESSCGPARADSTCVGACGVRRRHPPDRGWGLHQRRATSHRRLVSLRVGNGSVEPSWRARRAPWCGTSSCRAVSPTSAASSSGTTGWAAGARGGVGRHRPRVSAFDAATDGPVYGLAVDGGRLFLGGRFAAVDGEPRSNLASVTLAGSTVDGWRPAPACGGCNVQWDVLADGGRVFAVGRNAGAVVAYDSFGRSGVAHHRQRRRAGAGPGGGLLYAGGHFVEIGQPRQPRTILAALNPATGAVAPGFAPRFVTTWPGVWALDATGGPPLRRRSLHRRRTQPAAAVSLLRHVLLIAVGHRPSSIPVTSRAGRCHQGRCRVPSAARSRCCTWVRTVLTDR